MRVSGKTILEHVIERVLRAKLIDDIIVATTTSDDDEKIENLVDGLKNGRVSVIRGSEEDVLDRYYQAAKKGQSDVIVRITSDCPLIDWELLDEMVSEYISGDYDYVSNVLTKRTYPRGLDAEVFSFDLLKYMWESCDKQREREHVTTYIREHPEEFSTKNIQQEKDLSYLRWTVDEQDDFRLIKIIYEELYDKKQDFVTDDILKLIQARPELATINSHVEQKKNIQSEAN